MMRQKATPLYLLLFVLLAACSSATAEPPAAAPAEPIPEQPIEEPSAAISAGQTEDGFFFRGRPDAPVTMIDYSDFQ